MMQPAVCAVGVRDVDQLVGRDRQAQPRARLGAVVALDPFVQAVTEELLRELAVRAHVGGEDVDVVEPLHGGAAPDVALRGCAAGVGAPAVALGPRRARRRGRPVGEPVRAPVADVAVDPAETAPGRPIAAAPGAPPGSTCCHVPEAGLLRLGELQAVAQVVAPAAQEHRLTVARLLLHPEDVDEEAQALVRPRRQELCVADVRHVVQLLGHRSTSCLRPSRS